MHIVCVNSCLLLIWPYTTYHIPAPDFILPNMTVIIEALLVITSFLARTFPSIY